MPYTIPTLDALRRKQLTKLDDELIKLHVVDRFLFQRTRHLK